MEDQSLFAAALLPVALAFIMTSLGLALTLDDFRRVFIAPRGVAIGLANLLVISPLLAFGVAEVYGLAAVFATGLVLLGASPGGTTANMLTHLARGNTALSISMTAISSVAAVITVPLFLGLATSHFGADELDSDPEMLSIVARVFSITIVPLVDRDVHPQPGAGVDRAQRVARQDGRHGDLPGGCGRRDRRTNGRP